MEDNNELAFKGSNDRRIVIGEEFGSVDRKAMLEMNDGEAKVDEKKDGETVVDEEVVAAEASFYNEQGLVPSAGSTEKKVGDPEDEDACPTEDSFVGKQINNRYMILGSLGGKPLDPLEHSAVVPQPSPRRVLPIGHPGRVLDFSQNGRHSGSDLLEGAQIVQYRGVRSEVNGLEGAQILWDERFRREVSSFFGQEGYESADEKEPSEQGSDQGDVQH